MRGIGCGDSVNFSKAPGDAGRAGFRISRVDGLGGARGGRGGLAVSCVVME